MGGFAIRDNRNTFAKRQRETGKREKQAEKNARRQKRRETANDPNAVVDDPAANELQADPQEQNRR